MDANGIEIFVDARQYRVFSKYTGFNFVAHHDLRQDCEDIRVADQQSHHRHVIDLRPDAGTEVPLFAHELECASYITAGAG